MTARYRPTVTFVLLGSLAVAGHAQRNAGSPQAVFRASVDRVGVWLTVRDRAGRLITDLTRADFEVSVDGRGVAIDVFSRDRQPIVAAFIFDMAVSQEEMDWYPLLGRAFIAALHAVDSAVIGSNGLEVAMSPFITRNPTILGRVLDEELWFSGPGPVGTAVRAAIGALSAAPPLQRKRVVLIGNELPHPCTRVVPCLDIKQAGTEASEQNVLIYSLETGAGPRATPPARQLARATGGGYRHVRKDDDLSAIVPAVIEELRTEYLVGFEPAIADGRQHRFEVRTKVSGLTVHQLTRAALPGREG